MFAGLAARFTMPVLIWLMVFIGGVIAGYQFADAQGQARLADLQRQQAEQHAQAETLLRAELEAAQEEGGRLSAALAEANAQQTTRTVEVIREIPKYTDGRRCLGAAAVRLLDGANRAAGHRDELPQAAGQPAAPPAALAASDADVAGWIAEAGRLYNGCAGQLNALIDWHEPQEK